MGLVSSIGSIKTKFTTCNISINSYNIRPMMDPWDDGIYIY